MGNILGNDGSDPLGLSVAASERMALFLERHLAAVVVLVTLACAVGLVLAGRVLELALAAGRGLLALAAMLGTLPVLVAAPVLLVLESLRRAAQAGEGAAQARWMAFALAVPVACAGIVGVAHALAAACAAVLVVVLFEAAAYGRAPRSLH